MFMRINNIGFFTPKQYHIDQHKKLYYMPTYTNIYSIINNFRWIILRGNMNEHAFKTKWFIIRIYHLMWNGVADNTALVCLTHRTACWNCNRPLFVIHCTAVTCTALLQYTFYTIMKIIIIIGTVSITKYPFENDNLFLVSAKESGNHEKSPSLTYGKLNRRLVQL